jgi:hypothetical protein
LIEKKKAQGAAVSQGEERERGRGRQDARATSVERQIRRGRISKG